MVNSNPAYPHKMKNKGQQIPDIVWAKVGLGNIYQTGHSNGTAVILLIGKTKYSLSSLKC
jgi:hypothetical protein